MRRGEGQGVRAVAVLLVVLLALAGCSQQSSAPAQAEKEDVERAVEETPATTPPSIQAAEEGVTAPASRSAGAEVTSDGSALPTVNASASVDTSRMQNFDCHIQAHTLEEGMNAQESEAFGDEMGGDRVVEDMEAGGDKDVGDILDDMGVPAYEEQCGPPL